MTVRKTKSGGDPRGVDGADVEEIMKEMEEDGIKPDPQYKDGHVDDGTDEDEEEEETPKPKSKKEPRKPDPKKDDEEDDEDDDEDEDKKKKGKEDEDEDDEEEDDDKDRQKRPVKFLEGWQVTDLIKESEKRLSSKLETLVSDIKELVKKPVDQQTKKDKEDITDQIDEVKKIADEYGLDPEPLQKLADVILAKVKLPKDITEKLESLEEIKKERDQDDFWKKQETKFDSEFGELKDSEAFAEEFQKLSPAEIVTVKEKLNELAFTKRYSGYSLVDLLTLKQDELLIEKKKSATPGRGGSQRAGGGVDLSGKTELTADQINDLSDEEFDTYSANMKKEHKSPLKRRGNPVP